MALTKQQTKRLRWVAYGFLFLFIVLVFLIGSDIAKDKKEAKLQEKRESISADSTTILERNAYRDALKILIQHNDTASVKIKVEYQERQKQYEEKIIQRQSAPPATDSELEREVTRRFEAAKREGRIPAGYGRTGN